ncbi:MAG: hypothetical protein IKE46_06435 [Selenomonadaceae bacterium]|nr:hypothetical protein [Selenomonadaceae bacterium]
MKKFFAAMIAVTLLLCQNPAQAVDVRLCDNKIQNVVKALKFGCNELGIDIWGTEYYTYQGARRCEVTLDKALTEIRPTRMSAAPAHFA